MDVQKALNAVQAVVVNYFGSMDNTPDKLVAIVKYEGSGDQGDVEEISIYDDHKPAPEEILNLKVGESNQVDTALEDILYEVLDLLGHGGWENNDGGSGEMMIALKYAKIISLEHNSYYIESFTSSYGNKEFYEGADPFSLEGTLDIPSFPSLGVDH